MATPQLPYASDMNQVAPEDPGAFLGTLQQVPGVLADAMHSYGQNYGGQFNLAPAHAAVAPLPPDPAGAPPDPISATPLPSAGPGQPSVLSELAAAGSPASPADIQAFTSSIGKDVSSTRHVETAAEKAATAGLNQTQSAQQANLRAQGDLKEQRANELYGQIQAENKQLQAQEKDAAEQRVRMDAAVAEADVYLKKQRDAYAKDGMKSFYADSPKGTASLIASSLMVGLGAWSQALGGGQNAAWMVLKNATDNWENRERLRLEQQRELIGLAERDVGRAEQRKAFGEVEIKNKRIAIMESFARQRMENDARTGGRGERLANDALILKMNEDNAKSEMQRQIGLRSAVTTSNATQQALRVATGQAMASGGKPATESQSKANGALIKAIPEVERLRAMKPYSGDDEKVMRDWRREVGKFKSTTPDEFFNMVGSLNGTTSERLSPEGRRRFASETSLAEAVLRNDSGAQIGPQEYEKKLTPIQLFASDSAQTKADNRARRQTMLEGIAAQSNNPGLWAEHINGGAQRPKMSSVDAAAFLQFIQKNENSADPTIRAKVDAARRTLNGGH